MNRPDRPIRVALAGCGAVGGALLSRLTAGDRLGGRPVEVVRVLVRRPTAARATTIPEGLATADLQSFLATPADVVVEVIGGVTTAHEIARHVLGRGGRLVTANKSLLAAHGPALSDLAAASGGWLGFEAAVAGGVPVIRTLRHALAGQPILGFRGILNGTANYILSRVETNTSYAGALAEARQNGLAEADPRRDLDGRDVADKLAVLAWVTWGTRPEALEVQRRGLTRSTIGQARRLAGSGQRVRLIGECHRVADRVVATVGPQHVAADSPFGQTVAEGNRLEIDLGWGAPIGLSGPGAGGGPTAAAIWGDLLDAVAA